MAMRLRPLGYRHETKLSWLANAQDQQGMVWSLHSVRGLFPAPMLRPQHWNSGVERAVSILAQMAQENEVEFLLHYFARSIDSGLKASLKARLKA